MLDTHQEAVMFFVSLRRRMKLILMMSRTKTMERLRGEMQEAASCLAQEHPFCLCTTRLEPELY